MAFTAVLSNCTVQYDSHQPRVLLYWVALCRTFPTSQKFLLGSASKMRYIIRKASKKVSWGIRILFCPEILLRKN